MSNAIHPFIKQHDAFVDGLEHIEDWDQANETAFIPVLLQAGYSLDFACNNRERANVIECSFVGDALLAEAITTNTNYYTTEDGEKWYLTEFNQLADWLLAKGDIPHWDYLAVANKPLLDGQTMDELIASYNARYSTTVIDAMEADLGYLAIGNEFDVMDCLVATLGITDEKTQLKLIDEINLFSTISWEKPRQGDTELFYGNSHFYVNIESLKKTLGV